MLSLLFKKLASKFQTPLKPTVESSVDYMPIIFERINESLVSLGYRQANIGFFTGILCATLILVRFIQSQQSAVVYIWYSALMSVTLIRFMIVTYFLQQPHPEKKIGLWRNLFIFATVLGGICWGLASFLLLPYSDNSQQVLILMVMAGITAGAVPVLACVLNAAIYFLLVTLLPIIFYFLFLHSSPDYLMAVTVALYLGFLSIQSLKINEMLTNGLQLQFELHDAKNQLEITATHDPLTNVANRHLFTTTFTAAIDRARRSHKYLGLLYIDLDEFKKINDTYGHAAGDQILLVFVQRLSKMFKEKDIIARLGGDEFTILLENISHLDDIEKITTRIHAAMVEPIQINDLRLEMKASVGKSVYPIDGKDPETLLSVADAEMYKIKKSRYKS